MGAMERSKLYLSIVLVIVTVVAWAVSQQKGAWLSAAASQLSLPLTFGNSRASSEVYEHQEDWKLFHHLGGNGPWIQRTENVVEGGIEVPPGCRVDQVHMVGHFACQPFLC